jgi:hypothetical protein
MEEPCVDDTVGRSGSSAQAFHVFQLPSVNGGAGLVKGLRGRVRASKAGHLMAGTNQFMDSGRTYEARCASHKHAQVDPF